MGEVTISRGEGLSIGEVSRITGVNIETIRYYERVGVLPAPRRNNIGRRVYGPAERGVLAFIRRGRELGFSLNEVRTLLGLGAPGNASCAEVKEVASRHLADIRSKLADLARLERLLADAVSRCTGDEAPVCPVVDILVDAPAFEAAGNG